MIEWVVVFMVTVGLTWSHLYLISYRFLVIGVSRLAQGQGGSHSNGVDSVVRKGA